MAALAGIIDFRAPAERSRERLRAMQQAQAHRGPDGQAERFEGPIGLAHAALAVEGIGLQPLESPHRRYFLVLDGAIANADELRHTYAHEYPFDGQTDAEVLLAALALDGPRALPRFSGMFAFFFWDRETQRGLAARDRLGVKPLCYTTDGDQFRFASEARALLAARSTPTTANLEALIDCLLAPELAGDQPPFAKIASLAPGGLLEIDRRGIRVERWGRFVPARHVVPEATVLDDGLRRLYVGTNSVAAGLPKTGVWLSGGIDSSLIANAAQFSYEELSAFTIRFEGQSGFGREDDTPHAIAIAEGEELPHQIVDVSRGELARDLAALAECDDRLPLFECQLSMHHLAHASRARVGAVLVGHGVEEMHYGDPVLLDGDAISSPENLLAHFGATARLQLLHPELRAARPFESLAQRLRDDAEANGQRWGSKRANILATASLLVERRFSRKLHALDAHSAHAGLQVRVPFASNDLVELAERVDPEVGLKNGTEKWHLREGMRGELSDEARWRRHSPMPVDEGAEPVYRAEAIRVLSAPQPLLARLVDLAFVRGIAQAPRALSSLERSMLFQAITLSHWARRFDVR